MTPVGERDGDAGHEARRRSRRRRTSASAAACQRSSDGTATSRAPSGERRRSQRTATETRERGDRDDRIHNRERVVEPPAALDSPRVRLRRRNSLPRALRKPVSARHSREVPRLVPRARVVAAAPARPHARLPARLLGALARRRGRERRLLALPAVRPAGVGVLRDRVAGGVAEPPREREPHPQGALPAPARPALDRRHEPRLASR